MMEKYKQLTSSIFSKLPFVIKKYPERLLDVCVCFNNNTYICALTNNVFTHLTKSTHVNNELIRHYINRLIVEIYKRVCVSVCICVE